MGSSPVPSIDQPITARTLHTSFPCSGRPITARSLLLVSRFFFLSFLISFFLFSLSFFFLLSLYRPSFYPFAAFLFSFLFFFSFSRLFFFYFFFFFLILGVIHLLSLLVPSHSFPFIIYFLVFFILLWALSIGLVHSFTTLDFQLLFFPLLSPPSRVTSFLYSYCLEPSDISSTLSLAFLCVGYMIRHIL